MSRSRTMSVTAEEINNLDELMDSLDLMDDLGLDAEGVDDVEEAQRRLRQHLFSQQATSVDMVTSIRNVVEGNHRTKESLLSLMSRVRNFLSRIPKHNGVAVCASLWPDVHEKLAGHEQELAQDSPAILVAGETGSGKSTLLNILLGEVAEELLPVAHLSSTSVICELRYGATKKLMAYPRDPKRPVVTENLDHDALATLSRYVHQTTKDRDSSKFQYLRVEVFWPCDWLQGGIAIVDSPGVGEDDELTSMVKSYIPTASGFIYVINTPNAGGIDPERLQDLLLSHIALNKEDTSSFNPASAMFICNKWDQVPQGERDEVKRVVLGKLHDMWTGFSPNQVFFLSTKQTKEELQANYMSESYLDVMRGIERLIPMGFKAKMLPHYNFGKRVLERCLLEMQSFLRKKDEVSAMDLQTAQKKLDNLKQQSDKIPQQLQTELQDAIDDAIEELEEHLQKESTLASLCSWERHDCPVISRDFDHMNRLTLAYSHKRIRREISKWDSEGQRFQSIHQQLLASCRKHFLSIDQELQSLENSIASGGQYAWMAGDLMPVSGGNKGAGNFINSSNLSVTEKVVIGATAPVWLPLGMVVGIVALPSLGIHRLLQKRQQSKQLKQYEADPAAHMAEVTRLSVEQLIRSKQLAAIVEQQCDRLRQAFKRLFEHVPALIAADEDLLQRLSVRAQLQQSVKQQYAQLCAEGKQMRQQLDMLYVSSLSDYTMNTAAYTDWQELGKGSFATVYRASTADGKYVALKALTQPITEDSITSFLREELNLRSLQCDNVIHFHEAVINVVEEQWFPIFVMEYCPTTLDQVVYGRDYSSPARMPPKAVLPRVAARFAYGIANGLAHIHDRNFLHRDLKPQNILVLNGCVKIADLGLAKCVTDIKGTLAGTPLYMAPEVQRQEQYTSKADIFSFALILWELWFGCCVYVKFKGDNWSEFMKSPYREGCRQPDGMWKTVIETCWKREPKERLTALQCRKQLLQGYQEATRQP